MPVPEQLYSNTENEIPAAFISTGFHSMDRITPSRRRKEMVWINNRENVTIFTIEEAIVMDPTIQNYIFSSNTNDNGTTTTGTEHFLIIHSQPSGHLHASTWAAS
jgi:hypothetical protein